MISWANERWDGVRYLCWSFQRVPVEGDRVVSNFFDRSNDAGGVFGVRIQDSLLDAVLATVPELPGFDLILV